jgi:hypothetical protein
LKEGVNIQPYVDDKDHPQGQNPKKTGSVQNLNICSKILFEKSSCTSMDPLNFADFLGLFAYARVRFIRVG